jgi:hypothetical protein
MLGVGVGFVGMRGGVALLWWASGAGALILAALDAADVRNRHRVPVKAQDPEPVRAWIDVALNSHREVVGLRFDQGDGIDQASVDRRA